MLIAWGLREFHYILPSGEQALVVSILCDTGDGPQEVLRLPGSAVARIRAMLAEVEARHPTLVGEVKPITREVLGTVAADPDKAKLN